MSKPKKTPARTAHASPVGNGLNQSTMTGNPKAQKCRIKWKIRPEASGRIPVAASDGLPAALAVLPATTLGHLLRLLALDDVDSWAQARELAVAAALPLAAREHLDSIIAARLRVVCGGSAKKALAAATWEAAEVDGWWFRDEVGALAMAAK